MNENIDLTKILKNCPKGWKLYSPILGEIDFSKIHDDVYAIITVQGCRTASFTKEGFYYADVDGECLLFPSKEQRDWSKFTAPWYKKGKFDPNTLQPFNKVLVRDKDADWRCSFFSHIRCFGNMFPYNTIGGIYQYCIPYNDETKHLVGTAEEAPEFYRYWEK